MIQLIKKGGLRERANRSRQYVGSENTETTLEPNRYLKRPHEMDQTKSNDTTIATQHKNAAK